MACPSGRLHGLHRAGNIAAPQPLNLA
ncbi:uncharacterized protein METZ01_LOCUS148526 [marine metagenome]|uniref:Uncharacterized protein n=1 Tax=marine metagenome TaxID=408172 RepID=A0A382A3E3_9ZZZZ